MTKTMHAQTPSLRRLAPGRYMIATGPAAGTIIARAPNPQALPCFRWGIDTTPLSQPPRHEGFTLRGLARACARKADE